MQTRLIGDCRLPDSVELENRGVCSTSRHAQCTGGGLVLTQGLGPRGGPVYTAMPRAGRRI
jgi:hypothetical protein